MACSKWVITPQHLDMEGEDGWDQPLSKYQSIPPGNMELQNLAESDSNDSQPYSDLDNEDVEIFKELYNSVFDSDIINTNSDSDAIIKQDENTNDNVQSEKGFIQKFHKYLITDNKEDAKKLLSNRFDLNKFKELRKKTIFHKILLLLKTFLLTNDEKNIKLRLKDQFDLNEFKKSCLYYKMHSALVSNQVAIVKQLMNDEKLDLNKFLSERQLVALYVKMPSSSLYRFDTNNIFHAMYKALVFNTNDINRRVKLKYVRLIIKSMMLGGNKVLYQNKKYDNNTIETHLFTWAVLMNRQEMATLFWERIKNGNIATALFGGNPERTGTICWGQIYAGFGREFIS
uniref:Uncharacterized protein LOC102809077 n=1 Tax=Saccoglossus kowalevskii TaxID=10224 RepID=A0ABM0MVS4_SACKO|nr:PREDICTED: uncharacterized protein LOC102809077 [Saccoglossus kowalevskii]